MRMIKKILTTIISGFFFSVCVAQDLTICSSSSYTIPSIQGAGSAASYQWTENGVDIPGATDESYINMTVKTTGGFSVYVRMAYTDSCERQASNGVIVQVIDALDAPVVTAPADGCEKTNFVFTVPDIKDVTYEWIGEGYPVGNAYVYVLATPGEKIVTVRAVTKIGELTCASPYTSSSVTVYSQPEIKAQPASQEICPRSSASLSVSATHATSYQWLKNGVATTEGTGYTTHNYTTGALTVSATYQVIATNNGACSTRSNTAIVTMKSGCCDAPGSSGILFSEFNPCANAPDASTWTLTDQRDGGAYKVKKMVDGRYWMVQDLKFGSCDPDSFNNDDRSGDPLLDPNVADGYVGHCRTSTTADAGNLYNWAAAMNNPNGYWGSSDQSFQCSGTDNAANQCRGICPEGWHVPTKGEFNDAFSKFTGLMWEVVLGGYCNYNNNMSAVGSAGYYWSSSYNSNTAAFYLRLQANTKSIEGYDKSNALSIRCVRNY